MKPSLFSERNIPLFFLVLTIIAYGLLLPLTGFYWDDWPFAWIAKFLGPWEFIPAFSQVRPFLGPIFFVTTSLIPPVPLYWQIFAIIIRFAATLSAWFALKQVWPNHKRQTLIAALLFLVFPGYSQHWVAFTHINQEWIPFIFYLLSFGFTGRALRAASTPGAAGTSITGQSPVSNTGRAAPNNTLYALLFLVAGVFPTEYFVSIEPMRFLFIWVIVSEQVSGFRNRFLESFRRWVPYMLIWLANGAWLAYFYTIGGYESLYDVEVVKEPLSLLHLLSLMGEAVWKAGFYVWGQVVVLTSSALAAPTNLATWALVAISFTLVVFYINKLNLDSGERNHFIIYALLIGLAGILLGRIPSVAAELPLTLQSSFDRLMISMMLGASLFVTGLGELLIRNPRIKIYLFALLVALGVGQQFFNANIFRRDWTKQQEIYWQLAWRIPSIKPNTALLTDQMPIDYETDLSFTAPINWMYAPDYMRNGPVDTRGDLPYALFYTEKRLGGGALPSLEPNSPLFMPIRWVSFRGSTSQALVLYMPRNGCLRVLDPARGDHITYDRQSRYLVETIPLSDPSNILVDAAPAAFPFGPEPERTWCYYFAKAELAYQQGDWNKVIALIDEARSLSYEPADPFEWLSYIEAQARVGDLKVAEERSKAILKADNTTRKGLCELWKRVQARGSAGQAGSGGVSEILSTFQCIR